MENGLQLLSRGYGYGMDMDMDTGFFPFSFFCCIKLAQSINNGNFTHLAFAVNRFACEGGPNKS